MKEPGRARRRIAAAGAAGLLLACAASASFAAFEDPGAGARARGMGGAFSALADDYSAIHWNPAGLSFLEKREAAFSYEDRFNLGLVGLTHFALAWPGAGPGGVGIAWSRLATTGKVPEFDYSENTYTFAYGSYPWKGFSFGGSLNFLRLSSEIDASAYSLDFAGKYRWRDLAHAGLVWRNGAQTTLRYQSGARDELPKDLRAGLAYTPWAQRIKLAVEAEDIQGDLRKHAGAEFGSGRHTWAVRGGLSQKAASGPDWAYTLGASAGLRTLQVDYAYESHFDIGDTHVFAVKLSF
ncbi:MAG: hypothetical protein ACT4O3_07560 [Elusimicrobiota bacterium]